MASEGLAFDQAVTSRDSPGVPAVGGAQPGEHNDEVAGHGAGTNAQEVGNPAIGPALSQRRQDLLPTPGQIARSPLRRRTRGGQEISAEELQAGAPATTQGSVTSNRTATWVTRTKDVPMVIERLLFP